MQRSDFSGFWRVAHTFPSSNDDSEMTTEHDMKATQISHDLVLEGQPDNDGSYMLIRLTLEGKLATGTWHEITSPNSEYKGMMYSGAGQLLVSDDGNSLDGQWAGAGVDHNNGDKPRIYIGTWRFTRK